MSDYYKGNFTKSCRTRMFINMLLDALLSKCSDKDRAKSIEQSALYLAALLEGKTKPEDIKRYKRADSGKIEHQVIPFHQDEMQRIEKLLIDSVAEPDSTRIDYLKAGLKTIEDAEKNKITLDVAVAGRMATSEYLYPIDGALSLQHSFTTHAVDADIDWFTAVDDLVPLGSGHLDTQEFSSGVFYRYASLNLKQLQCNLGLIPQMAAQESAESRTRALDISAHLVHLLATVVPSAKQRSFAAFNPADLVMASFSGLPLSAANAFEKPVEAERPGGFLKPSIKALEDYISHVYTGFGLNDSTAVFSLWDTTLEPKKATIEDLKNWVRNDGQDA